MSNDSTSIIKTKLGNFTIKSKKKIIISIYPSKEINNIYKKNNYHNEIGLDIDKLLINKIFKNYTLYSINIKKYNRIKSRILKTLKT